MAKRVILAVGTKKGAFLLESGVEREKWDVSGPYLAGQSVMHMAYDERNRTLLAASYDFWFGARVYRSADYGRTWNEPVSAPRFPEGAETQVENIWSVAPGRTSEPGVVYASVQPAALFKSMDGGDSWQHVETLNQHPTVSTWNPSAGGLCMHSIILDPSNENRMSVAVSAGGFYATEDGGKTWEPRNQGVRADFLGGPPPVYAESGQCVHHVGMHPSNPSRLYQQNHCGVYRSDDFGKSWTEITNGLPSEWGLSMAVHPHDPNGIYVCVAISQMEHWPAEGRFTLWRTRDAGGSWEQLSQGLPQRDAFLNVHREGLSTDRESPCGVYVGANTGQLFMSRDEGKTWAAAPAMFPSISSVTAFSVD